MLVRTLESKKEREEYQFISRYAFEPEANNYKNLNYPEELEGKPLYFSNDQLYGCFKDKEMIAAANIIYFPGIYIRGTMIKMGGIAGVATKPQYRNRGAVRLIFDKMFQDMKQKNMPISVLYPFKYAYYEKFGYYVADEQIFYQFAIHNIKRRKPRANRYFKEVNSITEEIKQIYDKGMRHRHYMASRDDALWTAKARNSGYKFVCYNTNNEAVGYILLKFLKEDSFLKEPNDTIHVIEVMWLDTLTKYAIFCDFLKAHQDQRKFVSVGLPANENIIDLLEDPHIEHRVVRANSQARVIDIISFLEQITYPLDDFAFHMNISDPACTWNNGCFYVQAVKGKVTVTSADTKEIDLATDIGHFTQLVLGTRSIYELQELNFVTVPTEKMELFASFFQHVPIICEISFNDMFFSFRTYLFFHSRGFLTRKKLLIIVLNRK